MFSDNTVVNTNCTFQSSPVFCSLKPTWWVGLGLRQCLLQLYRLWSIWTHTTHQARHWRFAGATDIEDSLYRMVEYLNVVAIIMCDKLNYTSLSPGHSQICKLKTWDHSSTTYKGTLANMSTYSNAYTSMYVLIELGVYVCCVQVCLLVEVMVKAFWLGGHSSRHPLGSRPAEQNSGSHKTWLECACIALHVCGVGMAFPQTGPREVDWYHVMHIVHWVAYICCVLWGMVTVAANSINEVLMHWLVFCAVDRLTQHLAVLSPQFVGCGFLFEHLVYSSSDCLYIDLHTSAAVVGHACSVYAACQSDM